MATDKETWFIQIWFEVAKNDTKKILKLQVTSVFINNVHAIKWYQVLQSNIKNYI